MPIAPFGAVQGVLKPIFLATTVSAPTGYLAAFNGDPQGAGTELATTGGYDRILLPIFNAPSGKSITNSAAAPWAVATANYSAVVTHYGIFDNGTIGAGNLWWSGQLVNPKTILNAGQLIARIGNLTSTMGAAIAQYGAQKVLSMIFQGVGFTAPSIFVAAFNGDPQSGGTELTGTGGLTRIALPAFGSPSGRNILNSALLAFIQATANYTAPVTHFAFFDASSAGNLWWSDAIAPTIAITTNDQLISAIGQMSITQN